MTAFHSHREAWRSSFGASHDLRSLARERIGVVGHTRRNVELVSAALLVSLSLLIGAAVFKDPSAQAATGHNYLAQITEIPSKGPPPVEESVSLPGPLSDVVGMTISAGSLWVSESNGEADDSRVDKFKASGSFVSQFAYSVEGFAYAYQSAAAVAGSKVDPESAVYLAEREKNSLLIGVYSKTGSKLTRWAGAGTPAGSFSINPPKIAVDNSESPLDSAAGDVYVTQESTSVNESGFVEVFHPGLNDEEHYVTDLPDPEPEPGVRAPLGRPLAIAVDEANGDVLLAAERLLDGATAEAPFVVDEFEPTAMGYTFVRQLGGTAAGAFQSLSSVAVNSATGDVYVAEGGENGAVDQFNSAGVFLGRLTETPAGPLEGVGSVAVDPESGDVYVSTQDGQGSTRQSAIEIFGPNVVTPDVTTAAATGVHAKSATLNGTVDPDEAGDARCVFEYGTSTSFGEEAPCQPEAVANSGSPVAVRAEVSGLQTDTEYFYRLRASNSSGTTVSEPNQNQGFTTAGPGVAKPSVAAVTSSSATLQAQIDPNEAPTSYYFQYGTSTSYGSAAPAPPGIEIASADAQAVSVHLQGLTAATTYHYRVVAVSEPGGESVTVESPDEEFVTQASDTQVTQADGRTWELASPPNKHGAGIYGIGTEQGADIQAAADGGGITYTGTAPFVTNPEGSRSVEMQQAMSRRVAPGAWTTYDITTPHDEGPTALNVGAANEYKLFSDDLSLGAVEPAGDTPLPPLPAGAEKTIYVREASGSYKALVTSANVSSGAEFGGDGEDSADVEFVTASPDLRHVIIDSKVALEEGAPANGGLYEWSASKLRLVSVLPGGEMTSDASLGYRGSAYEGMVREAVSTDGSRIVWEHDGHDYLRDTAREETVQVDAPREVPAPKVGLSRYQAASADGPRLFFTSAGRLTSGSTAQEASGDGDLYAFELTSGEADPLAGSLTDLTVAGDPNESAHVLGVIGASEDGTYVYFVANGVLGDGSQRGAKRGNCVEGEGESPAGATCNLYMDHYEEGAGRWAPPAFITALAGSDAYSWGHGKTDLKAMTARVAPSGEYLAFMSDRSLTGYENQDANSGVPDEEVFVYDARSGALVCASCDPTGSRPAGVTEHFAEEPLWDAGGLWSQGGQWVAGSIPGWTSSSLSTANYQSRYLADSGRLFFDSADALVPADVNGQMDVYEYEPAGVGSCQAPSYGASASVVYSEHANGCVGLISAGTSSEESAFLEASETGGDVFFLTTSNLEPQDYDTSYDVYDAHECTPAAPCATETALPRPPCTTGDACKPAPTPQPTLFGAPPSQTFSGAGNVAPTTVVAIKTRSSGSAPRLARALKACRKKPRRERASCATRARRRYGKKAPGQARARRQEPDAER